MLNERYGIYEDTVAPIENSRTESFTDVVKQDEEVSLSGDFFSSKKEVFLSCFKGTSLADSSGFLRVLWKKQGIVRTSCTTRR